MKYFPTDVSLMIINYLNDKNESLKLLKILGIEEKYYTSKDYHSAEHATEHNRKHKIDKVVIFNTDDLAKIQSLKIKKIKMVDAMNFFVDVNNLPKSLTHLTFGYEFNQSVDNLPNTVTHLTFGFHFNHSIDKLPKNLTHLTFGFMFNKPIHNLPEGLTHLEFGSHFNLPINNLPNGLTHLTFSGYFNQLVDNLPNNLTHLKFGIYFYKLVDLNNCKKLVQVQVQAEEQKKLFINKPDNCELITHMKRIFREELIS